MPLTPLFTLAGCLAASVLTVLGVTDPGLTSQVQSMIVAAGGLVVAVLAYCHHTTKQNTDALSVAAVQAANQAKQLTATLQAQAAPKGAPVSPAAALASPSLVAALGQVLDARAGILATAPAIPAQPAGPTLAGPPVFPATASTPGSADPADDYPTQEIGALVSVPAR